MNVSIVRDLVRMGLPMGAQILVSVPMIALVNRFGVDTTAAYSALIQLWTYIMVPALAMTVTLSTMVAQNVDTKNWGRIKRTALVGMGYSIVITGAIVTLVYEADSYAYRVFLPSGSPALDIASHVNRIVTWSLVLFTIPMVLFAVVRAAGAVLMPLMLHILSLLIVRYALAALMLDRWQADAIWWSLTISGGVHAVLAALYYRYGRWDVAEHSRVTSAEPARTLSAHAEP